MNLVAAGLTIVTGLGATLLMGVITLPSASMPIAGYTVRIGHDNALAAETTHAEVAPLGVLVGPPSLSAQQIDSILASYNSPAHDTGEAWVAAGTHYGIDPAYAVAFFVQESTAGTHPAWAGWKSGGTSTYNGGNIICAGYATCYGRFRTYSDWSAGIDDWFRLIAVEYIQGRGLTTVDEIIPIYAPAFENDVAGYVATVNTLVATWRGQQVATAISAPPLLLSGCLGTNVRAALASSPSLRDVTIPAGADWSFNEHWQIDQGAGVDCGVFYGGVCNQASRYSYVARSLGLGVESVYHGVDYDAAVPSIDNLAIWSSGGRGGQDLVITNTSDTTVRLVATIDGDVLNVVGWRE